MLEWHNSHVGHVHLCWFQGQAPLACEFELKQFLECTQTQHDITLCQGFNEALRQCKINNGETTLNNSPLPEPSPKQSRFFHTKQPFCFPIQNDSSILSVLNIISLNWNVCPSMRRWETLLLTDVHNPHTCKEFLKNKKKTGTVTRTLASCVEK